MLRWLGLALVLIAAVSTDASAAPTPTRSGSEECFSAYEGAQSSRRSGRLVRSKSELAVCISECPRALKDDCKAWLTDVDAAIPRLSVVARGAAGEDLTSVEVEVDGGASTPVDLELDPGPHVIRVSAVGRQPMERRVVLTSGKHARETFLLEPVPRSATAGAETAPRPSSSVGPWILGGAGGVMLLAAGTLSLVGWLDFDDMKHGCAPRCANDRIDELRAKWVAGGIFAGAGVLALGGAAIWRILGQQPERASTIRVGLGGFQFFRTF